jgi:hypothetical protein
MLELKKLLTPIIPILLLILILNIVVYRPEKVKYALLSY